VSRAATDYACLAAQSFGGGPIFDTEAQRFSGLTHRLMSGHALGILGFIAPERRDRYRQLLSTARGRRKVTDALRHFRHFDTRCIVPLRPSGQSAGAIADRLQDDGAPGECYILSDSSDLDDKTLPLRAALQQIVGYCEGTIVVCRPGVLGYYEGEGERFLLKTPPRQTV
jgi:hypothetical protein